MKQATDIILNTRGISTLRFSRPRCDDIDGSVEFGRFFPAFPRSTTIENSRRKCEHSIGRLRERLP